MPCSATFKNIPAENTFGLKKEKKQFQFRIVIKKQRRELGGKQYATGLQIIKDWAFETLKIMI